MVDSVFTVPFTFASADGKSQISALLWTTTAFGSPDAPGPEQPKGVIQIEICF